VLKRQIHNKIKGEGKIMKQQNLFKGKSGESIAVDFLEKQGFKIIEKNWRFSRVGEIDIIAEDNNILVFVEVKAKTSDRFGTPLEAVSEKKFERMNRLAEIYVSRLEENNYKGVRFDLIGIILKTMPEITYYKAVY
jgi:putative endonuclease